MLKKCFYQVTVYLTVISLLAGILMTAGMPVPADAADAPGQARYADIHLIALQTTLLLSAIRTIRDIGEPASADVIINLRGVAWKPAGTYPSLCRSHDGNGHTISNLTTITRTMTVGRSVLPAVEAR